MNRLIMKYSALKDSRKLNMAYLAIALITVMFMYVFRFLPEASKSDAWATYVFGIIVVSGGYAGANVLQKKLMEKK